jgi:lysophospholipase L1-like esterase
MLHIKRTPLLLFIAVIMLAQTGYAQLTNTTKRTIVVMGSSSAYGWRATCPDSTWVNRLQKDLHFYNRGDTVIDIAYPGNTTYICLPTGASHPAYAPDSNPDYNVTKALSLNPTFVIISLPTNDIADGYSNSETLANYTTITDMLDAAHVPYILTGTQPRDLATDPGSLSNGGLTPAEQADLGTFNGLLSAQYPANSTYHTAIVNNFLTLLSVSSTNYEIKPSIGYGDGIHYVDPGHRIVYNTFLNFQLYKDLVNFSQTISFTLGSKPINTPDFDPGATSDFGLPITYTTSDTAVATITSGGLIHLVGTGTATITATQAGDSHHLPATAKATLTCVTNNITDHSNHTVCLYPNPATDIIKLCINTKTADSGSYKILVSNSSGIIVRAATSAQISWQNNVNDLPTGTYLIRVLKQKDDSLVGEVKFVKL